MSNKGGHNSNKTKYSHERYSAKSHKNYSPHYSKFSNGSNDSFISNRNSRPREDYMDFTQRNIEHNHSRNFYGSESNRHFHNSANEINGESFFRKRRVETTNAQQETYGQNPYPENQFSGTDKFFSGQNLRENHGVPFKCDSYGYFGGYGSSFEALNRQGNLSKCSPFYQPFPFVHNVNEFNNLNVNYNTLDMYNYQQQYYVNSQQHSGGVSNNKQSTQPATEEQTYGKAARQKLCPESSYNFTPKITSGLGSMLPFYDPESDAYYLDEKPLFKEVDRRKIEISNADIDVGFIGWSAYSEYTLDRQGKKEAKKEPSLLEDLMEETRKRLTFDNPSRIFLPKDPKELEKVINHYTSKGESLVPRGLSLYKTQSFTTTNTAGDTSSLDRNENIERKLSDENQQDKISNNKAENFSKTSFNEESFSSSTESSFIKPSEDDAIINAFIYSKIVISNKKLHITDDQLYEKKLLKKCFESILEETAEYLEEDSNNKSNIKAVAKVQIPISIKISSPKKKENYNSNIATRVEEKKEKDFPQKWKRGSGKIFFSENVFKKSNNPPQSKTNIDDDSGEEHFLTDSEERKEKTGETGVVKRVKTAFLMG